jgi:heme/copper-type cytochrome/quinol oxidase subunit 4
MKRGRPGPAPLSEDPVKTYKVSILSLVFVYVMLVFVTLIGFWLVYRGLTSPEAAGPVNIVIIAWLGVLAWIWYFYLKTPVAITWQDEGVLEFKSLIATTVVPVQDCLAIKAPILSRGFIKLTYKGGSLRLMSQMTGLYELIGAVKASNPRVEITGC